MEGILISQISDFLGPPVIQSGTMACAHLFHCVAVGISHACRLRLRLCPLINMYAFRAEVRQRRSKAMQKKLFAVERYPIRRSMLTPSLRANGHQDGYLFADPVARPS
jgi:hypothetical protein